MPIEATGCDGPARAGSWLRVTGSGFSELDMVSTTDHNMLSFQPEGDGSVSVFLDPAFDGPKELVFHTITGRYHFTIDVEPVSGRAPAGEAETEIEADAPRPIIDKVEPTSFPAQPVTLKLTGVNFTIVEEVLVGDAALQPKILSDTELTIDLSDPKPGQHDVVVKTWSNMTSEAVPVHVN